MNDRNRAVEVAVKAVATSIVAGAAGFVFRETGAPDLYVLSTTGATALASAMTWWTGKHNGLPDKYVKFRAGSLVGASVWTYLAYKAGFDNPLVTLPWLAGFITAPFVAPILATPRKPVEKDPEKSLFPVGRSKTWRLRMQRMDSKITLGEIRVKDWDNGHGYDVIGEFGPGGYTIQSLSHHIRAFESDANLDRDCGIELGGGKTKRDFIMRVTTKDSLGAEAIPYPDELIGPKSIYDDATVGIYGDTSLMQLVRLRQNSYAVMGKNSSGKTGFLHVLIAHHAQCVDELVWVIDLNNGSLGQWLTSWEQNGRVGKPPLDAYATDVQEATMLVDFALQIGNMRSERYKKEIWESGGLDVPISADIPAIRIIIDEPKMIWDNYPALTAKLIQLQQTLRAKGIRPDWGILGGTNKELPGDISAHVTGKAGLAVEDKADYGHFFGWEVARAVDLGQVEEKPGKAYLSAAKNSVRLGRFYRMTTGPGGSIERVAAFASTVRPELDQAAKELPGYAAYARRWDPKPSTPDTPAPPQRPVQAATQVLTPAEMMAKLKGLSEGTAPAETQVETEVDPFDALTKDMKPDPVKVAVIQYLVENGPSQTSDIIGWLQLDVTSLARPTLAGKLSAYSDTGIIENPSRGWWKLPD